MANGKWRGWIKQFIVAGVVLLISFPLVSFADSATSTNFKIETGVIDAGGSRATSSGFGLQTSVGQPATGISSSTSFILRGGFLNFPLPVAPTATTTPTSTTPAPATPIQVGGGGPVSQPKPQPTPEIIRACDFNGDARCNIVDLSIMLFYYEQEGIQIARYDLNINNRVDFPDVSVLMYYWTA
ncbi:MAG: hypothetical protein AAB967_00170 [Patescibacteria group bacterium]